MSATRVMVGVADLSGSQLGTLRIGPMVRRSPEPAYSTVCICGARSTASQSAIRNGSARCRSTNCGKQDTHSSLRYDRLADGSLKAHLKGLESKADFARAEASRRRMEAETEGYVLPAQHPPKNYFEDGPLTHRQTLELRARREELEAIDRADREAAEAPIKAAEAKLRETQAKVLKTQRARLLDNIIDVEAFSDPALNGVVMTEEQARTYNQSEFRKVRERRKSIDWTDELLGRLGAYFERNGLRLISAAMLEAALQRFDEVGLVPQIQVPAPKAQHPVRIGSSTRSIEPEMIDGWDLVTGEPKKWTVRSLDKLSSEEYRRALRLYKDDLQFPYVGGYQGKR